MRPFRIALLAGAVLIASLGTGRAAMDGDRGWQFMTPDQRAVALGIATAIKERELGTGVFGNPNSSATTTINCQPNSQICATAGSTATSTVTAGSLSQTTISGNGNGLNTSQTNSGGQSNTPAQVGQPNNLIK